MEYQEITRKDGTKIVFCRFPELLEETCGVHDVTEMEPYRIGNEFVIHCPFCKKEGHTKHKLYIKDDLSIGHCFVCCRAFVNIKDDIDTSYKVPDFQSRYMMGSGTFNLVPLTDPEWSLDKFNYEFDDYDRKGVEYLIGRHRFMADLYKVLGFKFWNGNVVMPFKKNGNVFYYQIRFTGQNKIRYYFPPISQKPPYIIERDGPARHKLLIVEGVYDAIAALIQCPEYTPVAVLGSSVSDYQLDFIRDYAGTVDEIKIWMDETKISKRIMDKVKQVIDYCPIEIIKSYGADPEEIMKDRMMRGLPLQWIKSGISNDQGRSFWNKHSH